MLALLTAAAAGCAALGLWQIERRSWKLELIERIDSRVHAPAIDLPARDRWAGWTARDPSYRKVRARGVLLHEQETLVQAVTERGAGFWVLTPLLTGEGIVLVNRGFVPSGRSEPATRPAGQVAGPVTITGLVRLSEPDGRFLRPNDPAGDRWFSRDVAAIARARGLSEVAPFFLDADAAPSPGGLPVAGLTVIALRNHHLVYALTWFALAGLAVAGIILLLRDRDEAA